MSGGHRFTVLRIMLASVAKLERKDPVTAPRLTPVTASKGAVHPVSVPIAQVLRLFMSSSNKLSWYSIGTKCVEKTVSARGIGSGYKVQKC
ncbi:hypothetical protein RB195_000195 [Necator americanus]|uniref:Uncharacterized protein n=1 Tax=Necator americanus TaxID=51031 RepID=A0ABR1D8K6_NECAM